VAGSIPPSLRPALEAYAARLRARFGSRLRQVRLFGSYARGEANEHSDVDVLVVVDGLTDMEMFDVVSAATPVLLDSGLPLAPLPMATEKLDEMRRRERLLARVLDDEGIGL
jgi:predicted nucleotidyltransferase